MDFRAATCRHKQCRKFAIRRIACSRSWTKETTIGVTQSSNYECRHRSCLLAVSVDAVAKDWLKEQNSYPLQLMKPV